MPHIGEFLVYTPPREGTGHSDDRWREVNILMCFRSCIGERMEMLLFLLMGDKSQLGLFIEYFPSDLIAGLWTVFTFPWQNFLSPDDVFPETSMSHEWENWVFLQFFLYDLK